MLTVVQFGWIPKLSSFSFAYCGTERQGDRQRQKDTEREGERGREGERERKVEGRRCLYYTYYLNTGIYTAERFYVGSTSDTLRWPTHLV